MSNPSALVTNNAATTIFSSLNTTDTTVVVAAGTGILFPNPTAGDYFFVTLSAGTSVNEIVKCTARNIDTLTIARGQDGTTAKSWLAGASLDLRIVAGTMNAAMAWNKQLGIANGIAQLDASIKIASSFLYVGGTDGLVQLVAGKIATALLDTNVALGIPLLDSSIKVPLSLLYAGTANGLATLDATGKVPASQLPSVDYSTFYLKTGGPINGNANVTGTFGVAGVTTLGITNTAALTSSGVVTGTQHNGVCAPTGNTNGKLTRIDYSTAAASGTPAVADGQWWIQHDP